MYQSFFPALPRALSLLSPVFPPFPSCPSCVRFVLIAFCIGCIGTRAAVFAGGARESPAPKAPAPVAAPEPPATPGPELIVFAAASLTESLTEVSALFERDYPGIHVTCNFDSSGTLQTQIQEGAACDVFISAGQRQVEALSPIIAPGTRMNLLTNELVLIVPSGKLTKPITGFGDVLKDAVGIVALGNKDVPVGQYAQEMFTSMGIWDQVVHSGKVSYGSNVKEVLTHVASGAADCGVVYRTDAATTIDVTVVATAPAGSHRPIVYPAAILARAPNPRGAALFRAFLKSDAAAAVFARFGFTRLP